MMRYLLFVLLMMSMTVDASNVEIYTFDNKQQEKAYHSLIEDLRCLVCQNQNISESNAELAKDMRRKTHAMIKQGKTQDEIAEFMVSRYGDFVLYRPPFKPATWLLWFGPGLFFFIGLGLVMRFLKRQNVNKQTQQLSEAELERVKNLHAKQDK